MTPETNRSRSPFLHLLLTTDFFIPFIERWWLYTNKRILLSVGLVVSFILVERYLLVFSFTERRKKREGRVTLRVPCSCSLSFLLLSNVRYVVRSGSLETSWIGRDLPLACKLNLHSHSVIRSAKLLISIVFTILV